MSTPTAAWPVPTLVDSLARARWGDVLDGRAAAGQRAILRALVALLPHGSGQGETTAAQVADAAGYSVRWTRHCLHRLEAAGIISWSRGWLDRGRPRPGIVRIAKTALVDLIKAARGDGRATARTTARAAALAERLAFLRSTTIVYQHANRRRNQRPLSFHAEVTATPPLHREVTGAATAAPLTPIQVHTFADRARAAARAARDARHQPCV